MTDFAQDRASFRHAATIVALSLGAAIGLGMARFAYTLILPDMKSSLSWTYAQAGLLNTVNAVGYLGGALTVTIVMRRLGSFNALVAGSLCCAAGLILTAITSHFALLTFARTLTGIGGAFTFVAGGALAAAVAKTHRTQETFLITLFYVGPGLGLTISALILPPIFHAYGPGSWWIAWAALGVTSIILTGFLVMAKSHTDGALPPAFALRISLGPQWKILLGYFIFGAGSMAYMTFAIAWIAHNDGSLSAQALFCLVVGLGIIISPWIWSRTIAAHRAGLAASILIAILTLGATIPLVFTNVYGFLISGALFGACCLSVVAATTAFVRKNFSESHWPAGIGVMTVSFGAGQIVGPVFSGWLSDFGLSLAVGLWFAPLSLAVAAVLCGLQDDLFKAASSAR